MCAVLKLLKMAQSVRTLLDTVVQALPEVSNLGLLFFLLFYIFAALGVELFGRVGAYTFQPLFPFNMHRECTSLLICVKTLQNYMQSDLYYSF